MSKQPEDHKAPKEPTDIPILALSTTRLRKTTKRVPLFTIDDVEYTIPAKPKISIGLRYLRDLRSIGENLAVAGMLAALLGDEGFNALVDYDDLELEEFEAIVQAATKVVFGEVEVAAGNSDGESGD